MPCGGQMSEHLDVQYLALVPTDARAVMSDESDDLRWFALDALPDVLDPSCERSSTRRCAGRTLPAWPW